MRNYIQDGEGITVTAPAAATAGDGVLVGDLFGIACSNVAIGGTLTIATTGVFDLPKTSTDDITLGAAVYWDESESEVTTTATDNTFIGHAVTAAGNPSGSINVRLSV